MVDQLCRSANLFLHIHIHKNYVVIHCADGLKNGDETGLDCGGSCDPCKGIYTQVYHILCLCFIVTKYIKRYRIIFFVAMVEIKLQGMEETTGISWRLLHSNCKSMDNLKPTMNRVYKKECLLSVDQNYTLQCDSTEDSWWKSNYVVIENSIYCEYVKGKKLINITVTGKI